MILCLFCVWMCFSITNSRKTTDIFLKTPVLLKPMQGGKAQSAMVHPQGYWALFSSRCNLFLWLTGQLASHQEQPPSWSLRGYESGLQANGTQWALAPGNPCVTSYTTQRPPLILPDDELTSGKFRQTRKVPYCKWKKGKRI